LWLILVIEPPLTLEAITTRIICTKLCLPHWLWQVSRRNIAVCSSMLPYIILSLGSSILYFSVGRYLPSLIKRHFILKSCSRLSLIMVRHPKSHMYSFTDQRVRVLVDFSEVPRHTGIQSVENVSSISLGGLRAT